MEGFSAQGTTAEWDKGSSKKVKLLDKKLQLALNFDNREKRNVNSIERCKLKKSNNSSGKKQLAFTSLLLANSRKFVQL